MNITGQGNIKIDGGDEIASATYSENIINNKNITLLATADSGYEFIGWYISDTLVSNQESYVTSINQAKTIEARFEVLNVTGNEGLAGWIIAVIVISSVAIIGLVIFIIIKIKKNSTGNYKKNYKY